MRRRSGSQRVRAWVAALLVGFWSSSAMVGQDGINIAEELLVDLDAAHPTAGEDIWENQGGLDDFEKVGDPIVEEIFGVQAVTFNRGATLDVYRSLEFAPEGILGPDPSRSIEVWVYNPQIASEETMVAWGYRGGPNGTNMSFNYGNHGQFGAIGHWGGEFPDIGWVDNDFTPGAPAAGQWHHLVYTYDGEEGDEDPTYTTRVYSDGCLTTEFCNEEFLGQGIINTHPETPIVLAAQIDNAALDLNVGLRGSLSLARVRIHDGVLSAEQILENYEAEKDFYLKTRAPSFTRVPAEDTYIDGADTYTALVSADGFPLPVVEAVAPPGATYAGGVYSYALPDPAPASFVATVRATNSQGMVEASWTVSREGLTEGEIAIAGKLVVHLDAEDGTGGEDVWMNLAVDSPVGDFIRNGDPFFEVISGEVDVPAVTFNAGGVQDDSYQSEGNAPAEILGPDPTRSIEVWAYNPEIASEETVLAWGRRGGPDGSNMSFNYGNHGQFGAVGHWGGGGPDIGWIDNTFTVGAPTAAEWHHLVYTYDGTTTRVYSDGVLWNSEVLGAGVINTHGGTPIVLASQLNADGTEEGGLKGSLSLSRVRIHDDVLTPEQIAHNYNTEFASFRAVTAPTFDSAPAEDSIITGTAEYTASVTVSGSPIPSIAVVEPAGATVNSSGEIRYTIPDPEPDSFEVVVRATNPGGSVDAGWTVTIVKGAALSAPPRHRYSFTGSADDSLGGADGTAIGDVTFVDGRAVLNDNNGKTSNGTPPGAYVDLPNGIISDLGLQATFEAWTVWDGTALSSWQRIFDFGNSTGGEDAAPSGTGQYYLFLTPRSGANTLRFGYRNGPPDVERNLNGPRLNVGSEQHIVVTWDEDTTTARLYVNGELLDEDTAVHFSLSEMDDVNNWLGRSQWNDPMYRGSYNEFRIYDYPLEHSEVLGNFQAGPDTLTSEGQGASLKPGDVNGDGGFNISDPVAHLNFLFASGVLPACFVVPGSEPVQLTAAGLMILDFNGDGSNNIADAVGSLGFQFGGGAPPALGEGCATVPGDCVSNCQ